MRRHFRLHSLTLYLVLGFLVLVLLTTLSAGLPAYWVVQQELQVQTWDNVANAQGATLALLQAEEARLADLAALLAARPTLQRLAGEMGGAGATASDELAAYLADFAAQSDLALWWFCDLTSRPGPQFGSAVLACPPTQPLGIVLLGDRPAIVASQPVVNELTADPLGVVLVGRWLDDAYLAGLAAAVGAAQILLGPDGAPLASSLPVPPAVVLRPAGGVQREVLAVGGSRYYAMVAPLNDGADAGLFVAVAWLVDGLLRAQAQARLILLLSTGLVASLGGLLALAYVRQLVAPLRKLTGVADRIAQGDLMAPIPLFSAPAEVSTLATALQQSQASMLRAIAELAQARDWLDSLIQSIVEGVVTFDTAGRVTFFSQGAETLTGWPAAAAVGQPISAVLAPAGEAEADFWQQLPRPGGKQQIRVRHRQGQTVVLAVTGARLTPPREQQVQVALVLRDVTQEVALRDLRAYFLANISHEFRTPLSTLIASMELLLDEQEQFSLAEVRELLQPSYLSLMSLQALIDNLLESSRIEAGYFAIRPRPVDLGQMLEAALPLVRPLLARRRQTLALAVPPVLPAIYADPARLTQVVVNLLTNASKYSDIGQAIGLQVAQTATALRVAVADRGPGVPPAERANVFRRFVRLNEAEGEQYGMGLGLYVAKTIVTAHGGQMGVDDRPGGGAIFWFELPLDGVPPEEDV